MLIIIILISIAISLLMSRKIYKFFESNDFKRAILYKIALLFSSLILLAILTSTPFNLKTLFSLIINFRMPLIMIIILVLGSTVVENYSYNRTNSYFMFLVFNMLITFGLTFMIFVIMCIINPIFLTMDIVKLIFFISLSILLIMIVYFFIKFLQNKITKKILRNGIQNNLDLAKKEESNVREEASITFCTECGFKLDVNTNFCVRCGKVINNKKQ